MQIVGKEFTKLQAVGAALLAMPSTVYLLIRIGGDLDFAASSVGWTDWQRDVLELLTAPPAWIVPLYVLLGVALILSGERRIGFQTTSDIRRSIETLESAFKKESPESRAIRVRARADFLDRFIPTLDSEKLRLDERWNSLASGYFASKKHPMSFQSSYEAPLHEFRNHVSNLRNTIESALMGTVSTFSWDTNYPLDLPVDGEEVAADAEKLISYRSTYQVYHRVSKNAKLCIEQLKKERESLNSDWASIGYSNSL